ncbi:MAG: hypothetical protein C5B54_04300, partial [Acidobacteria bacterium]
MIYQIATGEGLTYNGSSMGMQAFIKRVPGSIISHCGQDAEYTRNYILTAQPETETLCLKESWDGLHYVLSHNRRRPAKELDTMIVWDTSDLLGIAILGKEILNRDCKIGFGAPKWIEAAQVVDIAELLKDVEWKILEEEIIPEKMMRCGVYPEGLWDDEDK